MTTYLSAYGIFILYIPRPPRPTLFPYTTLFRSDPDRDRQGQQQLFAVADQQDGLGRGMDQDPAGGRVRRPEDRKSTRLNSSHVKISYAVFCLKKKKEKIMIQIKQRTKSIKPLTD